MLTLIREFKTTVAKMYNPVCHATEKRYGTASRTPKENAYGIQRMMMVTRQPQQKLWSSKNSMPNPKQKNSSKLGMSPSLINRLC